MISVAVASTDEDLTTTGLLKEIVLGATATSTALDAYLGRLIRRSSRWAESFIDAGPLTVQTYRETVSAFGRRNLMVSRTPIRAVLGVYRGTDTDEAVVLATSEFIVDDRDAGLIGRNVGFSWDVPLQWHGSALSGGDAIPLDPQPLSGQENKPWLVDYVAGWTYAGIDTGSANWSTVAGTTSTGRTLPEDVEMAIIQRGQRLFQNRDGVASESLGDAAVTYVNPNVLISPGGLASEEEMTLARYRRIK